MTISKNYGTALILIHDVAHLVKIFIVFFQLKNRDQNRSSKILLSFTLISASQTKTKKAVLLQKDYLHHTDEESHLFQ